MSICLLPEGSLTYCTDLPTATPPGVITARAGRVSTLEHEAFSGVAGPGGPHSLCELPRLPVGLLTPLIYLLHLTAAASGRDLPGSPPATDTHLLPARAQVSLDPLSTSWASQLRFHQTVSTPHHVISVPGWRWRQGFNGERMGVDSHGG